MANGRILGPYYEANLAAAATSTRNVLFVCPQTNQRHRRNRNQHWAFDATLRTADVVLDFLVPALPGLAELRLHARGNSVAKLVLPASIEEHI